MSKVVFQIELHPDDADRVRRVADAYGIEPPALIALAAYRYALRVQLGKEIPPSRAATRRAWCSVCGHSYTHGDGCNCP
ncbi:MAG: hypothetical protein M1449_07020 [Candidatus Thermoplasmatota archaeon]|nr:hypothetical protein [Candidatus Thermoplasmatota archaeon]